MQAAYLSLAPNTVILELDITPGAKVAGGIVALLDSNADNKISADESQSFARLVLGNVALTLDGAPATWVITNVTLPAVDALQSGNDILKIAATANRPESVGMHTLSYQNAYRPAKTLRMANIFLQPGNNWTYEIMSQVHSDDGGALTVTFTTAQP